MLVHNFHVYLIISIQGEGLDKGFGIAYTFGTKVRVR